MYEVLFDEYTDEKLARIKLTEGKYSGIIYHYNTVKFLEEDGDDAILQFEYDVVSTPEGLDVDALTTEDKREFENLVGDILTDIISKTVEGMESNENRGNDTIESGE